MKNFAEKIIAIREYFHLTQKELADITGFSRTTIILWEQKKRAPKNHKTLVVLSSSLHIAIAYFLADDVEIKYLQQSSGEFSSLSGDV